MAAVRFLQFSDVCLDPEPALERAGWLAARARERGDEVRRIAERACALARTEGVDAVLVPGGLWDDAEVSLRSVEELIRALGGLAPTPVLVAPGDEDPHGPASSYDPTFLRARGLPPFPGHVHVFAEGGFRTVLLRKGEVAVIGRAAEGLLAADRPLARAVPVPDVPVRILLCHAAREAAPEGRIPGVPTVADAELLGQRFSYAALGHDSPGWEIRDDAGRIRAAAAGRGVVLIGEVEGGGVPSDRFRRIRLDPRRSVAVRVNVTGVPDAEALVRRAREALARAGCRGADLALVELHGRHPLGRRPHLAPEALDAACFHATVVDRTAPDHPETRGSLSPEPPGLAARVARRFTDDQAGEAAGAAGRNRRALWYALDALALGRLPVWYESEGPAERSW